MNNFERLVGGMVIFAIWGTIHRAKRRLLRPVGIAVAVAGAWVEGFMQADIEYLGADRFAGLARAVQRTTGLRRKFFEGRLEAAALRPVRSQDQGAT